MSTMDLLHLSHPMGSGPYSHVTPVSQDQTRDSTEATKLGYYGDRSVPATSQLGHMNMYRSTGYQNNPANSYSEGML